MSDFKWAFSASRAVVAVEGIGLIVILVLVGYIAFLLRRRGSAAQELPQRTIVLFMVSWLLSCSYFIFTIVWYALVETSQNYDFATGQCISVEILRSLFSCITACCNLHVFYTLIHAFLDHTRTTKRPWHKPVRIYHWMWFLALVSLSSPGFSMTVIGSLRRPSPRSSVIIEPHLSYVAMMEINAATDIFVCIASWELIPWGIWMATRYPRCIGGQTLLMMLLLLSIALFAISKFAAALISVFWNIPIDADAYENMRAVGFDVLGTAHIAFLLLSWVVILRLWSRWVTLLKRQPETDTSEQDRKAVPLQSDAEETRFAPTPTPVYAELEGSYTQIYKAEAEYNQRYEADGRPKEPRAPTDFG
ncbi:hypothetical protein BDW74DRAFT_183979 [Aspergillus multicolor]|uniref:uncharacterized protein n=1 Tax=Aspergillus multicolor TaxID=41759 RepID=UPI003CCD50FA